MSMHGSPDVQKLKGQNDVDGLVKALRGNDLETAAHAGKALVAMGSRAAEALVPVLGAPDPGMARKASGILVEIGEAAIPPLATLLEVGPRESVLTRVVEVLSQMPTGPLAARLSKPLRNNDDEVRVRAAKTMGAVGHPALVKLLEQALSRDDDWRVRLAVVEALGRIDDPAAIRACLRAFEDSDEDVAMAAAKALSKKSAPAVEPLLDLLPKTEFQARFLTIRLLADMADERAGAAMLTALGHEDALIREQAARGLGGMNLTSAKEPLGRALEDSDLFVRARAAQALMRLGMDCSEAADKSLDAVIEALTGKDDDAQGRAIVFLGDQPSNLGLAPLMKGLGDFYLKDGRTEILKALGRIGDPAATEAVLKHVADEDIDVSVAAIEALRRIGNAECVSPVFEALAGLDEDSEREAPLQGLLTSFGDRVLTPLIRALESSKPWVQCIAIRALGCLDNETPIEPLKALAAKADSAMREEVSFALDGIGTSYALKVLDVLQGDGEERKAEEEADLAETPTGRKVLGWVSILLLLAGSTVAATAVYTLRTGTSLSLAKPDGFMKAGLVALIGFLLCWVVASATSSIISSSTLGGPGQRKVRNAAFGFIWLASLGLILLIIEGGIIDAETLRKASDRSLLRVSGFQGRASHGLAIGWVFGGAILEIALCGLGLYKLTLGLFALRRALPRATARNKTVLAVVLGVSVLCACGAGVLVAGEVAWDLRYGEQVKNLDSEDARVRMEAALWFYQKKDHRGWQTIHLGLTHDDPAFRSEAVRVSGSAKIEKALNRFVSSLIHDDPGVRQEAADALVAYGPLSAKTLAQFVTSKDPRAKSTILDIAKRIGPSLVPAVAALLEKNEIDYKAARLLRWIGDPAAVDPLIKALSRCHRNNNRNRCEMLEALGELGDAKALPMIEKQLNNNRVVFVHRAALNAIAKIDDEKKWAILAHAAMNLRSGASGRASELLATSRSPAAAEFLVQSFEARGANLGKIVKALVAMGGAAKKPLLAGLRHDKGKVRALSALALGRMGDTSAVDPLLKLLSDRDPSVRNQAMIALGELKDPRAAVPLSKLVGRGRRMSRELELALTKMGEAALTPMLALLRSRKSQTRIQAMIFLARYPRPRVVKAIVLLLPERGDGYTAARVLGAMGEVALAPLVETLGERNETARTRAAMALGKMDSSKTIDPLIEALSDESVKVRTSAVEGLSKKKDPRIVEPLMGLLNDPSPGLRKAVVQALGAQKDARAVLPLVALLKDDKSGVRAEARDALVNIGAPSIKALLEIKEGDARIFTFPALEKLRARQAAPLLIFALNDPNRSVRRAASMALKALGCAPTKGASRVHYLITIGDWKGIAAMGSIAVEPMLKCLRTLSSMALASAVECLGKIGDSRAGPSLIPLLGHASSKVRSNTLKALGILGEKKAAGSIIKMLSDRSHRLRREALEALVKITGEDFGLNPEKWQDWWEENRAKYE